MTGHPQDQSFESALSLSLLLLFASLCPRGYERSWETQKMGWSVLFEWVNSCDAGVYSHLPVVLRYLSTQQCLEQQGVNTLQPLSRFTTIISILHFPVPTEDPLAQYLNLAVFRSSYWTDLARNAYNDWSPQDHE